MKGIPSLERPLTSEVGRFGGRRSKKSIWPFFRSFFSGRGPNPVRALRLPTFQGAGNPNPASKKLFGESAERFGRMPKIGRSDFAQFFQGPRCDPGDRHTEGRSKTFGPFSPCEFYKSFGPKFGTKEGRWRKKLIVARVRAIFRYRLAPESTFHLHPGRSYIGKGSLMGRFRLFAHNFLRAHSKWEIFESEGYFCPGKSQLGHFWCGPIIGQFVSWLIIRIWDKENVQLDVGARFHSRNR